VRSAFEYFPRWIRLVAGILVLAQILLTVGYAGHLAELPGTRQFKMDGELNLPSWGSSLILIATAGACFGLWQTTARLRRPSAQWLAIAFGFLALSAEEVAAIHEDVGTTVGGGTGAVSIWPLVYSPLVIVGIWMLVRAVRDLPRPLALLALAGLLSYIGVLSVELLALGIESPLTIAVEENLEMLGTGLMFCALASELTARFIALFPAAAHPARDPGRALTAR
jgi:hypothetical protein